MRTEYRKEMKELKKHDDRIHNYSKLKQRLKNKEKENLHLRVELGHANAMIEEISTELEDAIKQIDQLQSLIDTIDRNRMMNHQNLNRKFSPITPEQQQQQQQHEWSSKEQHQTPSSYHTISSYHTSPTSTLLEPIFEEAEGDEQQQVYTNKGEFEHVNVISGTRPTSAKS